MNYLIGVAVVAVSIVIGIYAKDVNSLLQWIVSALWGSYVASNVLKWYWWRFNGHGYFWGMVAGLVPALVFPLIFKETLELYYFPLLLLIAVAGCIVGTYLKPPTDEATLTAFYKNVKPWGFWKPVKDKVIAEDPHFRENKHFKMDMLNVFVGIAWQTALVALPVFLVLRQWWPAAISGVIILITSVILRFTWWNKLSNL